MSIVPVTGVPTSRCKSRLGESCFASSLLLAVVFAWGCGGVTSGKSAQAAVPTGGTGTFGISGTISPATLGNGATLTLSGVTTANVTADSSGNYAFSGLPNGGYVVAPSRTGYSFAPGTQSVTINGADVTGVNFTASAHPTFSISGTISPISGGAGATVTLSGPVAATSMSDSAGAYTFTGLASGTYTVVPTSRGFSYTPASQTVTLSTANATAVNFTATAQAVHSVSLNWTASPTASVASYNVYRSTVSGSLFARVNTTAINGLAFTDSTVQNGATYYFVATAVDTNGLESVFSNQVPAVIP
jgi:Carboxypeptidase regulatory-like domain